MIKVKLIEPEKHRNECTFRPFVFAINSLRDIGLEFTTGDSYDYAWIAQDSIMSRNAEYEESVAKGIEFLSKFTGKYMIIDGQDSTSLINTYDVFKHSNALLLLKTSLLKDRSLYKQGMMFGRNYWGEGSFATPDIDQYLSRIKTSGTNWLSTHWSGINSRQMYDANRRRQYDVCAMFQYPSTKETETSKYYDTHRKNAIDALSSMSISITKLNNGERVPISEYYQRQFNSKIIVAPYGYGEMAPRDIESILFGNILIKPDMSHIETAPDIFEDMKTYVACKHDYSDLPEKIEMILGNYEYYSYIIENARKKLIELMHPHNVALHLYNIFNNL